MLWQGITAIQQSKQEKITYDKFLQMLDDKEVTKVKIYNDRISFTPISKETGAELDKTYYVIRIADYKIVDRLEKATSLARTMITMYGMSEKFGMVQLEGVTGEYLDNRRVLNCSSETETKVDTEVKNMMKASYEKAYKLLKKNMPTLDAIAQVLYEKENLSGKEFMELYEKYQNVKLTEAEKVQ